MALQRGLPILADHHEGRQENRLKRHHKSQGWPRALLQKQHPDGKQRGVNEDEAHRARESRDQVRDTQLKTSVTPDRLLEDGQVVHLAGPEEPMRKEVCGPVTTSGHGRIRPVPRQCAAR